ncbi:MAG: hypothetical protein K2W94_02965 [Alphaproteobacteria bacterium]|nr:hypothetical protein [Alphaproteobacteria bacterium]
MAEEARLKADAEEGERLAAEDAEKQKAIQAEIERAAQEAAKKEKKRAEKIQMAKNLTAVKEEVVKLGMALAEKEKELGDANAMIAALKAKIKEMKAKENEINRNIIASNKAEEKLLCYRVEDQALFCLHD